MKYKFSEVGPGRCTLNLINWSEWLNFTCPAQYLIINAAQYLIAN